MTLSQTTFSCYRVTYLKLSRDSKKVEEQVKTEQISIFMGCARGEIERAIAGNLMAAAGAAEQARNCGFRGMCLSEILPPKPNLPIFPL